MTRLIPTNQWVYHLYRVDYFRDEACTQLIYTKYIRAAWENHLESDISEYGPQMHFQSNYWYQWELVKENVSAPRVIGNLYGHPLHEPCLVSNEEALRMIGGY